MACRQLWRAPKTGQIEALHYAKLTADREKSPRQFWFIVWLNVVWLAVAVLGFFITLFGPL